MMSTSLRKHVARCAERRSCAMNAKSKMSTCGSPSFQNGSGECSSMTKGNVRCAGTPLSTESTAACGGCSARPLVLRWRRNQHDSATAIVSLIAAPFELPACILRLTKPD
eukprot:10404-Heterococcus_DN1.PRE.2